MGRQTLLPHSNLTKEQYWSYMQIAYMLRYRYGDTNKALVEVMLADTITKEYYEWHNNSKYTDKVTMLNDLRFIKYHLMSGAKHG